MPKQVDITLNQSISGYSASQERLAYNDVPQKSLPPRYAKKWRRIINTSDQTGRPFTYLNLIAMAKYSKGAGKSVKSAMHRKKKERLSQEDRAKR